MRWSGNARSYLRLPPAEFVWQDLVEDTVGHLLGVMSQVKLTQHKSKATCTATARSSDARFGSAGGQIEIHATGDGNDPAATKHLLPAAELFENLAVDAERTFVLLRGDKKQSSVRLVYPHELPRGSDQMPIIVAVVVA